MDKERALVRLTVVDRAQRAPLDRKRWTTHIELSSALFESAEVLEQRRNWNFQLDYVSPTEFERTLTQETA